MRILVITGAGCSTESGGFTYRGPKGLYNDVDNPERLMSVQGLKNTPYQTVECIRQLTYMAETLEPSSIHLDLAELEWEHDVLIATQNIDGLHQKAGSTEVCELHGSIERTVTREGYELPDIVLFGDTIKSDAFERALNFTQEPVDYVMCIGTTMNFNYLWELVGKCPDAHKTLIDIDLDHHYRAFFDEHVTQLTLPDSFKW